MVSRDKYKKLGDLYVTGTEVELGDGEFVIYMRALNPFEVDEARSHAQAARSRMVLALKDTESTERAKFDAKYHTDGREEVINTMAEAKANLKLPAMLAEVEDDPEWTEKMEVLRRTDELTEPPTEEEAEYVAKLDQEFWEEVRSKLEDESAFQRRRLEALEEDDLIAEFQQFWIERRGSDAAWAEMRVTELWYAARVCEGTKGEDGQWDHSECEGHRLQVWETRDEVKALHESVIGRLSDALDEVNMSVREGKGLGSPSSSSDSSALPSEEGESTPSTSEGTPTSPPGTSPSPSATD